MLKMTHRSSNILLRNKTRALKELLRERISTEANDGKDLLDHTEEKISLLKQICLTAFQ